MVCDLPSSQSCSHCLSWRLGHDGDNSEDETAAIRRATNDGTRCGEKCNGSTTKKAIVYFPPGTYLVSGNIALPFDTQVIGNANNRPSE